MEQSQKNVGRGRVTHISKTVIRLIVVRLIPFKRLRVMVVVGHHMRKLLCMFSWSFGVVLYEILTMGDTPYDGMHAQDMIAHLSAGNRLPRPKFASSQM